MLERKIGSCRAIRSWAVLWLFLAAGFFGASPAAAQGWTGVPSGALSTLSGFLPFGGTGSQAEDMTPLFFPPYFGGEARLRWLGLQTSKATLRTPLQFYNLKDSLGLSQNIDLMEAMFRFQFSRFSIRFLLTSKLSGYSSPNLFSDPNSGVRYRLGADLDLFQRMRSRLGVCLDYDLDTPLFNAIVDNQHLYIPGQQALTLGTYAVYNPTFSWCRYSMILEARFRWPISDKTKVTEYEFAGGIKTPETVLGSVALRGGYRHTAIDIWAEAPGFSRKLDLEWNAWFGELVYYY